MAEKLDPIIYHGHYCRDCNAGWVRYYPSVCNRCGSTNLAVFKARRFYYPWWQFWKLSRFERIQEDS